MAAAADCDWSFIDRPEVMEAISRLAQRSAYRRPGLQLEDVEQELHLWLAVRPELQAKPVRIIEMALYRRSRGLEAVEAKRDSLPLEEEIA